MKLPTLRETRINKELIREEVAMVALTKSNKVMMMEDSEKINHISIITSKSNTKSLNRRLRRKPNR